MFGKKILLLSLCTSLMAGCGAFATGFAPAKTKTTYENYRNTRVYKEGTPALRNQMDRRYKGDKAARNNEDIDENQLDDRDFAAGWLDVLREQQGLSRIVRMSDAQKEAQRVFKEMQEKKQQEAFRQQQLSESDRNQQPANDNLMTPLHNSEQITFQQPQQQPQQEPGQQNAQIDKQKLRDVVKALKDKVERSIFAPYNEQIREALDKHPDEATEMYEAVKAQGSELTPQDCTDYLECLGLERCFLEVQLHRDFVLHIVDMVELLKLQLGGFPTVKVAIGLLCGIIGIVVLAKKGALAKAMGSLASFTGCFKAKPQGVSTGWWTAFWEVCKGLWA